MKKFIIGILVVAFLGGSVYAFLRWQTLQKETAPPAIEIDQLINKNTEQPKEVNDQNTQSNNQENNVSNVPLDTPLPPELNLKMDFYAQAPFGIWDYPWQEACEEASSLLVANTYFKHQWSAQQFNEEILKLVEWEKKYFGAYEHTNMAQTAEMLQEYFHLSTKIHENPSYDQIQKILAKGHLIIMPLAGKEVKNPFYSNGGPVYHVLVVKGYKSGEKLITHDVGTRRGENYVYSWKTIQNALHDYAEPIQKGVPRIIEVLPPES